MNSHTFRLSFTKRCYLKLFLIGLFLIGRLPAKQPSDRLDIYLLIGQSNMAGRAPIDESDRMAIEGCYLLNDQDSWELAKNPMNRHSTIRKDQKMQKMNPGYAFGQEMRAADPEQEIGLVVNAKGGTSIEQWAKGRTFYNEAIRRTKVAMQSGNLKGILWHQGEANANDQNYLVKIEKLIVDLRADLNAPRVPFVAAQINQASGDYLFNELILKLPEYLENTAVVTSDGLMAMDRWHFDTESMKTLGKRYADKIQMLQQASSEAFVPSIVIKA